MTPSVPLLTLQVNWELQMVPRIPGRTSQGSRSPRSGAYIRYRHISEIGEQSRTIQLAHVHGRKPKNYGDIYNVRTTGGGGQGYTPRAPHPSLSIANRVSTLCPLFWLYGPNMRPNGYE